MEYIHTKTIERADAVIRVFRPVLNDEERSRRMKAIHNAAAAVIKAQIDTNKRK